VVCWAESGSKPNGLCRFGVKNARGVSFSGEKRGVCGENRGGCGEKVENSGEKCKFAGEKKCIIPSAIDLTSDMTTRITVPSLLQSRPTPPVR
jgi:hypothetical protein